MGKGFRTQLNPVIYLTDEEIETLREEVTRQGSKRSQ
jgi:hypothetical protein